MNQPPPGGQYPPSATPQPEPGAYPPPPPPPPQQPGYAPQPESRSKTGLIIGIVIALIVLGGGGIAALVALSSGKSREPVVVGPSGTVPPTGKGTDKQAKEPDRGDYIAFYEPPMSAKYKDMEISLKRDRTMEQLADALNETFALPRDVKMGFAECGQPNAFYSAEKRSIVICYEMLEFAGNLMPNDANDVGGAIVFLFFHELGHAVIDQYQLPVTGREEDAADAVASWVMIEAGEPDIAVSAAKFFDALSSQRVNLNFADEHSLDQQRFYNILCWIYGSNPTQYRSWVTRGVLPEARAARCPDEYKQLKSTWDKLITPYLKG